MENCLTLFSTFKLFFQIFYLHVWKLNLAILADSRGLNQPTRATEPPRDSLVVFNERTTGRILAADGQNYYNYKALTVGVYNNIEKWDYIRVSVTFSGDRLFFCG